MKRFTDTEIWKKPWYRKLKPAEKCAINFIKDMCDSVGVWDPDVELAEFFIGDEVDWEKLKENCNGNIVILENGKWWLPDFCEFQYGELQEDSTSKPIISYIKQLKKHGLWEEYQRVSKGYDKGMDTLHSRVQEKEKEKEKEKEQEKEKVKEKDKEAKSDSKPGKPQNSGKSHDLVLQNEPPPSVEECKSDEELYKSIQYRFVKEQPGQRFKNYGKEGKAIKDLIKEARARSPDKPEVFLEGMIRQFEAMRKEDTFYAKQPFLPSMLNSSGIFDRVLTEAKTRWETEQWRQKVRVPDEEVAW